MTTIKCKKDLYNRGLCFSKGKTYKVDKNIKDLHSLIDTAVTNNMGEYHVIGMWWRNFEII